MTTSSYFISLIIYNNNPHKLNQLVDLVIEKKRVYKNLELIIIEDKININSVILNQIRFRCKDKQIGINIIKNSPGISIYLQLKEIIKGDISIFTKSSYTPEAKWLEKLLQGIADNQVNCVVGEICDRESQDSVTKNYLEQWQ